MIFNRFDCESNDVVESKENNVNDDECKDA
jgi:hypothetical protein